MGVFGGKKPAIGLDIGSSAVKVAELKETKKGYQLVNFGMVSIPPEVIVDGAIMNTGAIVDAISTLLQGAQDQDQGCGGLGLGPVGDDP